MPQPAVLIRLRPRGPWRYGPGDGGADRVDGVYRSDRLYSALTLAMRQIGFLDEWLEATARTSTPAVTLTSLFPYQGETLFAPPPATLWPPPPALVTTPSPVFLSKTRWATARFVPLTVIEAIFNGQRLLADQWIPDAESGCLLRRDRPSSSPFRIALRSGAAVDRLTRGLVRVESSACVEFEPGSGLWAVLRYADQAAESAWKERLMAAVRLLADTGFGGRRTAGWGQSEVPLFSEGSWPNLLFPKMERFSRNGSAAKGNSEPSLYWLLSLYSPSLTDTLDWAGGDYRLTIRGGRIESPSGSGAEKKIVRMVCEGSVVSSHAEPVGAAIDVAPDGFAHPVYRSGLAVALKLPIVEMHVEPGPVETPVEAVEQESTAEAPAVEPIEDQPAAPDVASNGAQERINELESEPPALEPPKTESSDMGNDEHDL